MEQNKMMEAKVAAQQKQLKAQERDLVAQEKAVDQAHEIFFSQAGGAVGEKQNFQQHQKPEEQAIIDNNKLQSLLPQLAWSSQG